MTPPNDRDIGMIGAGPVGLFMANLIGLAGHRVWHQYAAQRSRRAEGNPQTMYVQQLAALMGD